MFTGIVEETGRVTQISTRELGIAADKVLKNMEQGGSIAVNGVCLTVTDFDAGSFSVNIMAETLKRTNLGRLQAGYRVNLEGPLTLSKPLGGHLVQGHIDGTGRIASFTQEDEASIIRIEASPEVMRYVVVKGFIAVDGISLTVVDRDSSSFTVSIVDYTLKNTTLGSRQVGDLVNLEVDIIAKYVEQSRQGDKPAISLDFLRENGFLAG